MPQLSPDANPPSCNDTYPMALPPHKMLQNNCFFLLWTRSAEMEEPDPRMEEPERPHSHDVIQGCWDHR